MRIIIDHKGEDYVGIKFATAGKPHLQYAEVSLHDYKILNELMNIQSRILNQYPDNAYLDDKLQKVKK